MTPAEAVREIEEVYDKKLTDKQTVTYTRFLGKFNREDISRILEKAIEEARYLPRISQLNDAAKDLLILKPQRKTRADPKCEACHGTGWEYVKVTYRETGDVVEAVQRCDCRSRQLISEEGIPF